MHSIAITAHSPHCRRHRLLLSVQPVLFMCLFTARSSTSPQLSWFFQHSSVQTLLSPNHGFKIVTDCRTLLLAFCCLRRVCCHDAGPALLERYRHFVVINNGMRGPFAHARQGHELQHWTHPFTQKLDSHVSFLESCHASVVLVERFAVCGAWQGLDMCLQLVTVVVHGVAMSSVALIHQRFHASWLGQQAHPLRAVHNLQAQHRMYMVCVCAIAHNMLPAKATSSFPLSVWKDHCVRM